MALLTPSPSPNSPDASARDIRSGYFTLWGGATFGTSVASGITPGDSWGAGLTGVQYAINTPTTAAGSDNT